MRRFLARALHFAFSVLLVTGVLLVADAIATVVWQEPVSTLYARAQQERLERRLEQQELTFAAERQAAAAKERAHAREARRLAREARSYGRDLDGDDPVGRIDVPELGLSSVVLADNDLDVLRNGPGHFPTTRLPGEGGTVAIAGHRTTYSAPFRDLDDLERGDEITLKMPYGTFTYAYEDTKIVEPDEISVIRDVGHERVVLTACHPLYSADERIVVFARLEQAAAKDETTS